MIYFHHCSTSNTPPRASLSHTLCIRPGLLLFVLVTGLIIRQGDHIHGDSTTPDPAFDAKGFQPGHEYYSPLPFEHIDTVSGNVYLTFTDLVLPANGGFALSFQRSYNSKDMRWTFGIGGIPMSVAPVAPIAASEACGFPTDDSFYFMPIFAGSDGADHKTLWTNTASTGVELLTSQFWSYDYDARSLKFPNGLKAQYNHLTAFGPCGHFGRITTLRDPFGNQTDFEYTGLRLTTVRQHLGNAQVREVWLDYNFDGTLKRITSEGRIWTYHYELDPVGNPRLRAVDPPEPPSWTFTYTNYDLTTITTPNGGTVSYSFGTHTFWRDMVGSPQRFIPTRVLETRRTDDRRGLQSEWTFTFDSTDDNRLTMTGPSPGPSRTIVYISGLTGAGHIAGGVREIYQGTELLQRERVTYGDLIVVPRFELEYKVPIIESRSIERGGATYTTDYQYRGSVTSDYGRPDYGAPHRIVESGGRTTDIIYDHLLAPYVLRRVSRVIVTQGGESFEQRYSYDAGTGFKNDSTIYGIRTRYGNDGLGNVGTVTDDHNHTTSQSYRWGVLEDTITDRYTITRGINPTGTVAWEQRRGHRTYFQYDRLDRRTVVDPPLGHNTVTTYDTEGDEIAVLRNGAGLVLKLDGFGRIISTVTSGGVKTKTRYDADGRITYQSLPYTTAETGTTFSYDGLGRVLVARHGDNERVLYAYPSDADVHITDEENHVTYQSWSAFGDPDDARLTHVLDAEQSHWYYDYNALNRLTRVRAPEGSPRTWTYRVRSDGVRMDLVETESHPESGTTTYRYDAAGRLEGKTTATASFTFGYDANDRLNAIYNNIDAVHNVFLDYDESDNRVLVRNEFVTSRFQFDAVNRLEWRRDKIAGVEETETRYADYDGWDNLKTLVYPSSNVVNYTYDVDSRVGRVTRGADLVAEVLEYHPSGAIKRLQAGNGIQESFDYHPHRYWLTGISGLPVNIGYGYDAVGNVSSITDGRPEYNQLFEYDKLDRLRVVHGFATNQYQYDTLGNRKFKQNPEITYDYNADTKRLEVVEGPSSDTEVGTYHHDNAGNLKSDRLRSYTYTPFNMLETVRPIGGSVQATYRYDGDNLRKLRVSSSGAEYFAHGLAGHLLTEWHQPAGGQLRWRRDYVYLGSRLVASMSARQVATIAFTVADAAVAETTPIINAPVRLTTSDGLPLEKAASVSYVTTNNTATAGVDYTSVTGVLSFAAGTTSGSTQSVTVSILRDILYDPSESFGIHLSGPTEATLGVPAIQTVTIVDEAPLVIDEPAEGEVLYRPLRIRGWAVDFAAATGTGVDAIHVHAYPNPGSGQPSIFVGAANYGESRPDVGAIFGTRFTGSGYTLARPVKPGQYLFAVFARRTSSNTFDVLQTFNARIVGVVLDTPMENDRVNQSFPVSGWGINPASTVGTGVANVFVTGTREDGTGTPVTIQTTYAYGRSDIQSIFGSNFFQSGYGGWFTSVAPGQYRLDVVAYDATGAVVDTALRRVTVMAPDVVAALNPPVQGAIVTHPFLVAGWAIDRNAPSGSGVDMVHVWAFLNDVWGPSTYLGMAAYGVERPDIAAIFGEQFRYSGFNFLAGQAGTPTLAPGRYVIAIYPRSTVNNAFAYAQTVTVNIQ